MGAAVQLVEDNSLHATDAGYEVQLRLNWYRSLPLSSVESVQFSLDGQKVDPGDIRFGINGHQYRLDQLDDLVEEFWFVQDSATLKINRPGKVAAGEAHTIDVEMALRFPYIPIGPGRFLVNTSTYSATQVAG